MLIYCLGVCPTITKSSVSHLCLMVLLLACLLPASPGALQLCLQTGAILLLSYQFILRLPGWLWGRAKQLSTAGRDFLSSFGGEGSSGISSDQRASPTHHAAGPPVAAAAAAGGGGGGGDGSGRAPNPIGLSAKHATRAWATPSQDLPKSTTDAALVDNKGQLLRTLGAPYPRASLTAVADHKQALASAPAAGAAIVMATEGILTSRGSSFISINESFTTKGGAGGGVITDWSADGAVTPSKVNRSSTAALPGLFRSEDGAWSPARL